MILVAKKVGAEKWWKQAERCLLLLWMSKKLLPERDVVYAAAQRALHALGVATEWDKRAICAQPPRGHDISCSTFYTVF
ncbi:MAG: hypothetical protein E6I91_07845 [Chloroflexi bacterium]|nr:MAG: hypothetical protein E6I91_07845 [Chloroflexota bacterium]